MRKRPGYSKEVRKRAVRLILTSEHDHSSRWAATQSAAAKIGCTPETLRTWINTGSIPGITTDQAKRKKDLECENRKLKRANEILSKAAAYFAQAELDRKPKSWSSLSRFECISWQCGRLLR
jgi:transposase